MDRFIKVTSFVKKLFLYIIFFSLSLCSLGCRWSIFASSTYKGNASDLFSGASHGLIVQSYEDPWVPFLRFGKFHIEGNSCHRNHAINQDGWGIGYYNGSKLHRLRSALGATLKGTNTPNKELLKVAPTVQSNIIFSHIRASTDAALSDINSHPFTFNKVLWMHNGGCANREALIRLLEKYSINLPKTAHGATDSEYIGALFAHYLGGPDNDICEHDCKFSHEELVQSLANTIADVKALSKEYPSSLNFALTNGRHIVVSRYRSNHEDPPSLYFCLGEKWDPLKERMDGLSDLNVATPSGKTLLISSEPISKIEYRSWFLLLKDQVMTYDTLTGHVKFYCLSDHCLIDFEHRCADLELTCSNYPAFIQLDDLVNEKIEL